MKGNSDRKLGVETSLKAVMEAVCAGLGLPWITHLSLQVEAKQTVITFSSKNIVAAYLKGILAQVIN